MPNLPATDRGETADLHIALARRLTSLHHSATLALIEDHIKEDPGHVTLLQSALDKYQTSQRARTWVSTAYGPAKPPPTAERDPRDNAHVYAKSAAASVELGQRDGIPVIVVDGAQAKSGGGASTYLWFEKISLCLSMPEACELLMVLMARLHSAKMQYHGSARDKSLEVTTQGQNVLLKFTAAGEAPRLVPVTPRDQLTVANLLLRYLSKLDPGRTQTEWLSLIQATLCRKSPPTE